MCSLLLPFRISHEKLQQIKLFVSERMTQLKHKILEMIDRLGSMGDTPVDSDENKQHHRFLVYMAILMSMGGLLWGSLSLWFEFYRPSIIPFGYILVTIFNLFYFARSKNFENVRSIQVTLSLLLPVVFQLSLGGFINSGAVMLWSLLALGGSLTFSEIKLSYKWLILYVISTIFCGFFDETARQLYADKVSQRSSSWFFVINIASISSIFVVLMLLILRAQRNAQNGLIKANDQMSRFAEQLEQRVQERTRALKGALSQTAAIVEHLADGIVAFNQEGELSTYNKAFATFAQVASRNQNNLQYPDYVQDLKKRCLATQELQTIELCLNKDKTLIAHASPIMLETQDKKLELNGCVVLIRDVSSERRLSQVEEQLAISEKMSALGTLAAGIAHEINNPLTYVMSNLEMIRDDLGDRAEFTLEKHAELLELSVEAIEGLERIAKIVQELRSFMRSSERSLSEVKLSVTIKSALSLATPELRLNTEVICEVAQEVSNVYVDEGQLVQVLVNLLINAAQAFEDQNPNHNRIWIRASEAEDQMVLLEVEDNASGMPPEVARQAFDPFFTTKTAVGTGLGLAICHKIIHGFGGSIQLESELGRGSCFKILLPRFQPDLHRSSRKKRSSSHRAELAELKRVVVIDDEPSVGQVIIRTLGQERVQFFTKARQGLEEIDRMQPQVIICDIMMPEMSGVEVYAQLKQRGLTDRTLMITGGSAREEVADFILQEAPSMLYKPFKPSELRERVCSIARSTRSYQAINVPEDS